MKTDSTTLQGWQGVSIPSLHAAFIQTGIENGIDMKTCSKCQMEKPMSEFYKCSKVKSGLQSNCKECHNARFEAYSSGKHGLVTRINSSQRQNSKRRGDTIPTYSKQELREWLFSQKKFHELYDNWRASGYEAGLKPSCDRLDNYKGYSLDNLQLMTWQENNDKGYADRKNGINNKMSKAVTQLTGDGEIIKEHYSAAQASRETKIRQQGISQCCNGSRKSAGGFVWKFKKEA